jgi:hypothetical protein
MTKRLINQDSDAQITGVELRRFSPSSEYVIIESWPFLCCLECVLIIFVNQSEIRLKVHKLISTIN